MYDKNKIVKISNETKKSIFNKILFKNVSIVFILMSILAVYMDGLHMYLTFEYILTILALSIIMGSMFVEPIYTSYYTQDRLEKEEIKRLNKRGR